MLRFEEHAILSYRTSFSKLILLINELKHNPVLLSNYPTLRIVTFVNGNLQATNCIARYIKLFNLLQKKYSRTTRRTISGSDKRTSYSIGKTSSIICLSKK